jgi:hypothetical protein
MIAHNRDRLEDAKLRMYDAMRLINASLDRDELPESILDTMTNNIRAALHQLNQITLSRIAL